MNKNYVCHLDHLRFEPLNEYGRYLSYVHRDVKGSIPSQDSNISYYLPTEAPVLLGYHHSTFLFPDLSAPFCPLTHLQFLISSPT